MNSNNFNIIFKNQAELVLETLGLFDWESCFALKGGTAINYFYSNMPRLSIDIDLVYLPVNSRVEAINEIKANLAKFIKKIKNIYRQVKIIKESKSNPVGILYIDNSKAKIKIEPNIIIRGTVIPTKFIPLNKVVSEYFNQELEVKCLDFKEIMAGKLVASFDRQHPRDIFDAKAILSIDNKNELKIIVELFVIYLSQSNRPFSELLNPKFIYFENLYNTALEGTLREKYDIYTLIQNRIDVFEAIKSNLTPGHKEFLISLMSLDPKWELLSFENIHCLPGIQWKLKNIEMMNTEKRLYEINMISKL
jgi:predicted nucleotidyltransferase component of viral defense system